MTCVTRILLDVLKPHHPSCLELARAIAAIGEDYRVRLTVNEMDEKTETIQIEVSGQAVDFDAVQAAIKAMGGALHSIDAVDVRGSSAGQAQGGADGSGT